MELKKYQLQVIKDLDRFLELLIEKQNISKAYNALWNEKGINVGIEFQVLLQLPHCQMQEVLSRISYAAIPVL